MGSFPPNAYWSEDIMETLYDDRDLSPTEIADILDANRATVDRWLERHGLRSPERNETCPHCESEFINLKKHLAHSHACGPDTAAVVPVSVPCDWCGDTFDRIDSETDGRNFCDQGCLDKWYESRDQGCETTHLYSRSLWRERAQEIRERDSYRCQHCGMSQQDHRDEYGCALHVHHIIELRKFDNEENAHDPDNLVTLCAKHHRVWEGVGLRPV